MFNGEKVSIVFPAYNEEDNIAEAVQDFQKTGYVDEIIVVDNNSRDHTAERAKAAGARVVVENESKAMGLPCNAVCVKRKDPSSSWQNPMVLF